MRTTDEMIATLTGQVKPVRTSLPPAAKFAAWSAGSLVYVALLVLAAFKTRPDLMTKLTEPLFAAEIGSLLLVIFTTSLSAALLSFPDLYQKRRMARLPLGAFALFAAVLAMEWVADHPASPLPPHNMECLLCITLLALPPTFVMLYNIRRMAPTLPGMAGSTALLSSFGIGALTLRLSEPTNSINHLLVWHYLPMIGVGAIGLWLGKKLFRW